MVEEKKSRTVGDGEEDGEEKCAEKCKWIKTDHHMLYIKFPKMKRTMTHYKHTLIKKNLHDLHWHFKKKLFIKNCHKDHI